MSYTEGEIKAKMRWREKKYKSIKSAMASVRWLEREGLKRDKKKREKACPLRSAEHFGQAFLKLDAWCESTRGQWGNKSPEI